MSLLNKLKESIKQSRWYGRYLEKKLLSIEFSRHINEANWAFSKQVLHGSLDDYKDALKKHHVSFSEYMFQYEYWNLNENQRNEFLSRSDMQAVYRHMVTKDIRSIFHNKELFLRRYSKYIVREWMIVEKHSFEEFKEMISQFACIAKPIQGSLGRGVFKITSSYSDEELKELYKRCVSEHVLLEECVNQCEELASFHPASLNTIRVSVMSNGREAHVLGSFLRMGNNGSCVDNAHAGGIFAQINIGSGVVESEGIDTNGGRYNFHPLTNKPIIGFVIPKWTEIVALCKDATLSIPMTKFVGWDVCIRNDGCIEFIEGNHGFDVDVLHSPLKVGLRRKIDQLMEDLYGCNLDNYQTIYQRQVYQI